MNQSNETFHQLKSTDFTQSLYRQPQNSTIRRVIRDRMVMRISRMVISEAPMKRPSVPPKAPVGARFN